MLLRNETEGGKLGEQKDLKRLRENVVGFGYACRQPTIAHFGLSKTATVDLKVVLPHNKVKIVRKNLKTNQRLTILDS